MAIYDTKKPLDKERARLNFERILRDEKVIEVKEVKPRRSYSQNAYLHFIIGLFCIETGYNSEEGKQLYKRVARKEYYYEKNGVLFVRSSAELDTQEMTSSIEKFREYCLENLGFTLPSPEDKAILQAIEFEMKNQGL